MSFKVGLFALVVAALVVAAFFPSRRVRTVASIVSGAVCVLGGVLTLALVVGAFVLESRGGGALLLFAPVTGLVAWVAWLLFSASRRYGALRQLPIDEQRRATLKDFDATLDEGLARLDRLRAERDRVSTNAARRAALNREIAHEERMLGLLPTLRPALEDERAYQQEGQPTAANGR